MTTQNASVFNLCPPLLFLMAISILVVQFSPTTHPDVLPLQFADSSGSFGRFVAYILAYAAAFIWAAKPKTPWDWACVLSASVILPASTLMLPYSLSQTVTQSPVTFDRNVVSLDGAIGFQSSIEVAGIFAHFPHFADVCRFFYDQVLAVIGVAAAGEAYYGKRLGVGAIPTFLLMSSIGFLIYFALPVVGPAPFFGDSFPLITGQLTTTAPRNCMPSLHAAYALMAFLSTRGTNIFFRITVGVMSTCVAIATLGLGEHYLTDLVLAVPLVTMFRAVSTMKVPFMSSERIAAFLLPASLLLIWGSVIRGALGAPHAAALIVIAMLITVGSSLFLERRLTAVEHRDTSTSAQDEHALEMPMVEHRDTSTSAQDEHALEMPMDVNADTVV